MERDMDGKHARLMDEMYSVQRHLYDATRPFFLFGRDRLIGSLRAPVGSTILEVGCGTARNLVKAADAWPETRLYGVDISVAMLDTARRSVEHPGLADRIHLARGDAGVLDTAAMFGLEEIDRIYFSYTLSMMPPWREALRRAAERLAPGGSLHVVDFGQYDRLPDVLRRIHFRSMADYHVTPRADLPTVMRGIADDMGMAMEFTPLYRGYAWSATLRRAGLSNGNAS